MATRTKHRFHMVCALMIVAAVADEASVWAETIDRQPVRATFVRRFGVPVVSQVLGPQIGGRSYARASDVFDNFSFYPRGFWWTRAADGKRWTLMKGQPSPLHPWLVAPDPARPDTVYSAEQWGPVSRSEDAGATWERRGWPPSPCNNPDEIRVTETGLLVVISGSSICRSADGGLTWNKAAHEVTGLALAPGNVPPVPELAWIVPTVDPTDARHLLILAGAQNESAPNRLFESFDGGASWIAHAGLVNATALRVSASTRGLEIEAFGRRGIFKTLDRGDSWILADQGMAADSYLDLAAAGNGDLYLLEKESGGVWRSQDSGLTWELRGFRPGLFSLPEIEAIAVDPFEPAKLVTFSEGLPELWWSDDGGRTWAQRESPKPQGEPLTVFDLAFDPHRRGTVYIATIRDAWVSADRGFTWRRLTRSLSPGIECSQATGSCTRSRTVYSVVPDSLVPGRLFIDYDTGSFRTDDAGATWKPLPHARFLMRPDPRIKDRLYLGSTYPTTTIYQSDRAGGPPWRRTILKTPDTHPQFFSDWLTFDPQGRLVVAPSDQAATFLRRLGESTWERFSVALPYEEDVRLLEPIVALPGGGARMFMVVPGLGLFRADVPASFEP